MMRNPLRTPSLFVLAALLGAGLTAGTARADYDACSRHGHGILKCEQRDGDIQVACRQAVDRCCDGADASSIRAAKKCLNRAAAHERKYADDFGDFSL